MSPSRKVRGREVEVKLRFADAGEARRRLAEAGASEVVPRTFEDNLLYDTGDRVLEKTGRLLRLRRFGERACLTFKAPVAGGSRHKVREECETGIDDFDAAREILERLGYRRVWRYQKLRTKYDAGGVEAALDETPLGCFVELEGQPDAIDALAGRLGFGPGEYVLDSYRDLHERRAAERGETAGDLLMDGAR